ncbi:2-C-methyl-D-erythritol 2,4-cyclodiphosphate synthase [Fusibacter ferrireducens]|uniref:2-C-methyl-D-erythritol 2,4-cyclodiphosphate synthase n=1 Tax=Fusibacter ferrireducens TaxID=2785058 RepID=A0ABS0A256_9FIRM|nr:2-C-methyl-D-erythritol 2,4-cyclodiphosphate synthase [Fusibacter ferrireducens]MBF4695944.1 2-C-methyl-D-erythritol 2,4-cyclodiphosphate synthase [Fusibacter ferrireducens]
MKIGIGYDVHRLTGERRLIIGGVEIAHDKGLLGHSDADVLLHAVMDAILGALGKGDIGKHFPDQDMAFKDISSMILLEKVAKTMQDEDYRIGNIDAVIVAQKPKMAPHIALMQENIGRILNCSSDSINIKATTTEWLGFEGREEGISAQAVVLLEKRCL